MKADKNLAEAMTAVLVLMRGARDDSEMAVLKGAMRNLVDFARIAQQRPEEVSHD